MKRLITAAQQSVRGHLANIIGRAANVANAPKPT
jgi:hypothetical protein